MPPRRGQPRRGHNLLYKANAIKLALERKNIKATARDIGIHYQMLRRWIKEKDKVHDQIADKISKASTRYRLPGGGRPATISPIVEDEILEYIDKRRELDFKVTMNDVLLQLRKMEPSFEEVQRHHIRRRLWSVFRRRKITLRRTTHHAQNSHDDALVISDFQNKVKSTMNRLGITFDNICNFDETNVYFAPDSKLTLNRVGARTISVIKANKPGRCSVMIGCSGTGHKFDPLVIFLGADTKKGKIANTFRQMQNMALPRDANYEGYPVSMKYRVQSKAWMTSNIMVDWVERVYKPWAVTKEGPTVLIMDEFRGHKTEEVKNALDVINAHIIFIPGGFTSKLQVMDVGLNKPFKDSTNDGYDRWYHDVAIHEKPTRQDVSQWIKTAWEGIREDTILKTWQRVLALEHLPGMMIPVIAPIPVVDALEFPDATTTTANEKDDDDDDLSTLEDIESDDDPTEYRYNDIDIGFDGIDEFGGNPIEEEDDNNKKKTPPQKNATRKSPPSSNASSYSLRSGDTVLRSSRRLFDNFEASPEKNFY